MDRFSYSFSKYLDDKIDYDSSVIESTSYSELTNSLKVVFKGGATYLYSGVPLSVYKSFLMSESKGSFISTKLKGYPYKKIEHEEY